MTAALSLSRILLKNFFIDNYLNFLDLNFVWLVVYLCLGSGVGVFCGFSDCFLVGAENCGFHSLASVGSDGVADVAETLVTIVVLVRFGRHRDEATLFVLDDLHAVNGELIVHRDGTGSLEGLTVFDDPAYLNTVIHGVVFLLVL